jgi:hypothetical protein
VTKNEGKEIEREKEKKKRKKSITTVKSETFSLHSFSSSTSNFKTLTLPCVQYRTTEFPKLHVPHQLLHFELFLFNKIEKSKRDTQNVWTCRWAQ